MSRRRTIEWFAAQKQVIIAPGHVFPLVWDDLEATWPDNRCFLVALDERQLNVVHSALSIAYYYKSFWGMKHRSGWVQADFDRWDTIHAFLANLEGCLMSGCNVEDLIASVDSLTAAVAAGFSAVNVLALDTIRDTLSNWMIQEGSADDAMLGEIAGIGLDIEQQTTLDANRNDRLGDINTSMGIVGDRIAPDGNDLFTPIDDLVNIQQAILKAEQLCCGNLTQSQSVPNDQLSPDEIDAKCRAANIIYDEIEYIILWMQSTDAGAWTILTLTSLLGAFTISIIDGPLPFADAIGLGAGAAVGLVLIIVNFVTSEAAFDMDDIVSAMQANKTAIIQALYESLDTDDAINAFNDNLTSLTMAERAIVATWVVVKLIDLLFDISKNKLVIPESYVPSVICTTAGGYQGLGPDIECVPPIPADNALLTMGNPKNIFYADGSLTVTAQQFTAEFDGASQYIVNIRLVGWYNVTVTAVSRSVQVQTYDCDTQSPGTCWLSNTTADGVPSTYKARTIIFRTSDGSFTIDLEFNQNPPTITGSC